MPRFSWGPGGPPKSAEEEVSDLKSEVYNLRRELEAARADSKRPVRPASEESLGLGEWFGLSYASWLTLPRVLMEAMPENWQKAMAELLWEYDETYSNAPSLGTRVQVTDESGKLVKTPRWLINYRHPDYEKIKEIRGEN